MVNDGELHLFLHLFISQLFIKQAPPTHPALVLALTIKWVVRQCASSCVLYVLESGVKNNQKQFKNLREQYVPQRKENRTMG